MIPILSRDFPTIRMNIAQALAKTEVVEVGEWQARVGAPEGRTIELQDVTLEFPIPTTQAELADLVEPNLPWAEDHFQERVSGQPLNPPPSSDWWPFNVRGNEGHKTDDEFSHTYPERMWPKLAGRFAAHESKGVRFDYGDLGDLVGLFEARPDTRQGYLPIWFPEDLNAAAVWNERVPCTLGYHMMQRHKLLTMRYYLRSCDFVRHFVDDVYMAARLCQWVCEQVSHDWVPGDLIMYVSSMHAFAHERSQIQAQYEDELVRRIQQSLY